MHQIIKNYILDEAAVDEAVGKMLLIVITIGCCMAVGWWVWNSLESRTKKTNCGTNNQSPFCME